MAKTNITTQSGGQIIVHSSDGKDAAVLPSAGNAVATTGNVVAKTATVHGDLKTTANTHVIFDNPA